MNYTEQCIKVLKKVNESSEPFHISSGNKNYSDTDKQILTELINAGYVNGKHRSPNRVLHFLEVSPTVKSRIFQDDLEQKQNERTLKGRILKYLPITFAVVLGFFFNIILEILKKCIF